MHIIKRIIKQYNEPNDYLLPKVYDLNDAAKIIFKDYSANC